eukprot:scaffold254006_cov27-Tisochrysis_lutea.AAC.2
MRLRGDAHPAMARHNLSLNWPSLSRILANLPKDASNVKLLSISANPAYRAAPRAGRFPGHNLSLNKPDSS